MMSAIHQQEPFDAIEITETGGLFVSLYMDEVSIIARLHGDPYTFYKYTPDVPLGIGLKLCRMLQRIALRHSRLLIAPTHAHAQEIAAELGTNHPPFKIIPNAISLSQIKDNPQAEKNVQNNAYPIVLFVGRLERVKGIPVLLKAAQLVLRDKPNVRFVFAGSNHPTLKQKDIDEIIQQLSLEDRMQFLGHVPREQLFHWYYRASLCVLPSYYETFGLAALEPMAFGVPVVATIAGGLPEVIEDGVTGLLVTVGNPEALATAICKLLNNEALRKKMSIAAQYRVQKYFDIERLIGPTVEIYQNSCCN
jgi:glycosyltransferase involved in cell wall biosynthesis